MNGQCCFPYGTLPSGLSDLHGKKAQFWGMIAYCMNAILFAKFSKRKQVDVYMEVKTIACSKQIWDLLTALVLGLHGNF